MAFIPTKNGDVDESLLQRYDYVEENDDIKIEAIEYCRLGCLGEAHKDGVARGDGCFCPLHVHRSVHGTIKRLPQHAEGVAASLT